MEFKTPFKIAAIQTQGRSDTSNQWVTSYKLSYGYDGISWNDANGNDEGDMVNLMYQSHSIIVLIIIFIEYDKTLAIIYFYAFLIH